MAPKPPALGSAPGNPGRSSVLRAWRAAALRARGAETPLRYHAGMLTRRQLMTGVGVTALAFTGFARVVSADSATAITVYKNPT